MAARTSTALRAAVTLALVAGFVLLLCAPALACPRTSLAEIDDEVMCPICGTTLGAAGGPQAEDERDFIRERAEQCDSKDEIKAALVAEYGKEVLALPERKGFNLVAYIVPVAGVLLAAIAIFAGARRWRREQLATPDGAAPDGATDTKAEALRADMDKYDL